MLGTAFLSLLATAQLALGRSLGVVQIDVNDTSASNPAPRSLLAARDGDPADFRWARRWAAVGDSYTAGIGSGRQLGGIFHKREDWYCSRYDLSYPYLVNGALGSAVENFQFPACSGDRSEQIYEQIQNIDGTLDLVMMTAGGNDLCLVSCPGLFVGISPLRLWLAPFPLTSILLANLCDLGLSAKNVHIFALQRRIQLPKHHRRRYQKH